MQPIESMPQRLVRLRRAQGLSQENLAEALSVSRQAVSKWETGRSNPSIRYLAAMSHILNVSTDYILCGKHPAEPGGAPRSEALPPRIRFYGLLALGVSLLTLGFAGALALALASTGQRWSMQMGERIYTGLAGYRLCNPPLQQIFILCVIMCVVGLLLSAADLMLYGLLRLRFRAAKKGASRL